MRRGVVVIGTDTGIGKTVVSAGLVRALDADYWKPVQAGLDGETDTEAVMRLAGIPSHRAHAEAYRLATPASPHRAAALDGVEIDPARLLPPITSRKLVIETAGGLLVPLTASVLQADVVARWNLPVVLVAATRLGTINHTLLTLEALRARAVDVAGIIFTGEENADTVSTICAFGRARALGRLPPLDPLDSVTLRGAFSRAIDIGSIERTRGLAP